MSFVARILRKYAKLLYSTSIFKDGKLITFTIHYIPPSDHENKRLMLTIRKNSANHTPIATEYIWIDNPRILREIGMTLLASAEYIYKQPIDDSQLLETYNYYFYNLKRRVNNE